MLFNSFEFAIFLPAVFLIYWSAGRGRAVFQNLILIAAGAVFYGWWDPRFLLLLGGLSAANFAAGRLMEGGGPARKKSVVIAAVAVNLCALGFFKYFNFFIDSFAAALMELGIGAPSIVLRVALPVGVSFYTFQLMTYTLDVHRGKTEPVRDAAAFFAFAMFFPQLVAGPIERAANMLPRFARGRVFDTADARDGLRRILWGLFKKTVVADRLAVSVAGVFGDWQHAGALSLLMGSLFFTIQIYCDFSGYSDIAIGVARLFGVKLMRNFSFPYFAGNIADFWRRWHISLSTWFRDYLYIPLGGGRGSMARRIRNILITFTVSGLWHGANWTFILWGLLHGLCYIPWLMWNTHCGAAAAAAGRNRAARLGGALLTFFAVNVAWIFFRADTVGDAFGFIERMLTGPFALADLRPFARMAAVCAGLLGVEWLQRGRDYALEIDGWPLAARWAVYYVLVWLIVTQGAQYAPFIYFKF